MVSIKDIAQKAGVNHSTVSRALNNHPRISQATKTRIQALAKEMGYQPNPAMAALVAYRTSKLPASKFGTLVVLSHRPEKDLPEHLSLLLEGIRQRARQIGFEVNLLQVSVDDREQYRLSRSLYYQGIRGVIVSPFPWSLTGFEWDKFSVVGIGENAMQIGMNYVAYDNIAIIKEVYRQLKRSGYKRIGLHCLRESEERNSYLHIASYHNCLYLDGLPAVPPLMSERDDTGLVEWIREHRFDAIMTYHKEVPEPIVKAGIKLPEQLGVAGYSISDAPTKAKSKFVAGYIKDPIRLGALAVDFTQSLIQKNQFGLPTLESSFSFHIRGYWHPGETVRAPVQAE